MLTRRDLLAGAAALGVAGMAWSGRALGETAFNLPLPIPELVDARRQGGAFSLVAAEGRHSFGPDRPEIATYGYSSPYLGPVIKLHSGDSVEVSVENRLSMSTTSHWHGLLVPSWADGGPHDPILPGAAWRPVLDIDQPEATAWYHAHAHNDTGRQVYMGLAGMMIIEDGTGERLGLPRTYGVDDLPLILQDRMFERNGELMFRTFPNERIMGMRGDTLVTNGVVGPYARVPAGLVRLRLLNAANARNFHLFFSDHRSFKVIASDGGYLPAPVPMAHLTIAPSERFEIVVDFSDGGEVLLETLEDHIEGEAGAQGMGRLTSTGPTGLPSNGPGAFLRFEVDPALPVASTRVPDTLVTLAAPDAGRAALRRTLALEMWPGLSGRVPGETSAGGRGSGPGMSINGKRFDMHRVDFTPALGSTEIWEVTGSHMPHPFHIHGALFRVLSIDGAPPPAHLAGYKDTALVHGPTELLIDFTQPATHHLPFMIHCHILDHEDGGMMGQYMTV